MLKPFRERAYTVRGGKIDGYILQRAEDFREPYAPEVSYFTLNKFNSLVRNDKVQFFQWKNGKPVLEYTADEILHFFPNEDVMRTVDSKKYYGNDICFLSNDITNSKALCVSMLSVHQVMLDTVVKCALYAPGGFPLNYCKQLSQRGVIKEDIAKNFCVISGTFVRMHEILRAWKGPVSVCIDTAVSPYNKLNNAEKFRFRNLYPDEINFLAEKFLQFDTATAV